MLTRALNKVPGDEQLLVVSILREEGLVYFICVAPLSDFAKYDPIFHAMLDSVRFTP